MSSMAWRCKFCGFEIPDREDRRIIKIKEGIVFLIGYCDNCHSWNILDRIPMEQMREHVKNNLNK